MVCYGREDTDFFCGVVEEAGGGEKKGEQQEIVLGSLR
jgi:hypothetical protein